MKAVGSVPAPVSAGAGAVFFINSDKNGINGKKLRILIFDKKAAHERAAEGREK